MPIDGFVPLSSGESISSTEPSPMPVVFSVRETRIESARRSSSGTISCSHIRVISCGGPGITAITLPSRSTHQPGAVPRGLGMARAEGMSIACLRLRSGIAAAPRLAKNERTTRSCSSSM